MLKRSSLSLFSISGGHAEEGESWSLWPESRLPHARTSKGKFNNDVTHENRMMLQITKISGVNSTKLFFNLLTLLSLAITQSSFFEWSNFTATCRKTNFGRIDSVRSFLVLEMNWNITVKKAIYCQGISNNAG